MTHQWHDTYRHFRTPAHHLDPRSKLGAGLVFLFMVLFTPVLSRGQAAGYAGILVGCAWMARVPAVPLLKRLLTVMPFVLLMVLSLLLSRAHWGNILQVTSKSILSITAMALVTFTTPFPDLLRALEQLRVPRLLTLCLAFLYRYGAVIAKETVRVERGWTARYFGRLWHLQWMRLGNVLAALLLRSYERAERVYAAMVARGFSQDAPAMQLLHFGWEDAAFLSGAAAALAFVRWGLL